MEQLLVMTRGIETLVQTMQKEFGSVIGKCLQAHNDGIWDWFDEEIGVSSTLCDEDIKTNDSALQFKDRLLSSWKWQDIKFWIITDIGHKVTTILLPDEY
jgi:hypothetical protein